LYLPLTGLGKIERATGPKPQKRASVCFSPEVAGRSSFSTAFRVRMAAMTSRALAFSPLAKMTFGCVVFGVTAAGSASDGGDSGGARVSVAMYPG
jgi:hypothetical protein